MKRQMAGFVALVLLLGCCVIAALAEQVAAEAMRVYKTGLEHPLSGKIVWVSYLPAVEMVSTVEIIPFQ